MQDRRQTLSAQAEGLCLHNNRRGENCQCGGRERTRRRPQSLRGHYQVSVTKCDPKVPQGVTRNTPRSVTQKSEHVTQKYPRSVTIKASLGMKLTSTKTRKCIAATIPPQKSTVEDEHHLITQSSAAQNRAQATTWSRQSQRMGKNHLLRATPNSSHFGKQERKNCSRIESPGRASGSRLRHAGAKRPRSRQKQSQKTRARLKSRSG